MILVTGHRGFIGSKLFEKLDGDVIGIDIREGKSLLTCDLPQGVETIYHLAAQSDVVASWEDPTHDMDNIRMTARLAHNYPQAKIIYANSCAALDPKSPYGFSKGVCAEYLNRFHGNTVNLVFPNIFGPGSRSVVDIFKDLDKVNVYGDGHQTRDYVHVDDLVQGLLRAYDWKPGEYFMGSGKSFSVLELAGIREIEFHPARKEPREVEVPNTTPDWEPEIGVIEYING